MTLVSPNDCQCVVLDARALLDSIQWVEGSHATRCPSCHAFKEDGHLTTCPIDRYLKSTPDMTPAPVKHRWQQLGDAAENLHFACLHWDDVEGRETARQNLQSMLGDRYTIFTATDGFAIGVPDADINKFLDSPVLRCASKATAYDGFIFKDRYETYGAAITALQELRGLAPLLNPEDPENPLATSLMQAFERDLPKFRITTTVYPKRQIIVEVPIGYTLDTLPTAALREIPDVIYARTLTGKPICLKGSPTTPDSVVPSKEEAGGPAKAPPEQ
jgi:hypothetical protein